MPDSSLHADAPPRFDDVQPSLLAANWAGIVQMHFASLSMASLFVGNVVGAVDVLGFRQAMRA